MSSGLQDEESDDPMTFIYPVDDADMDPAAVPDADAPEDPVPKR